MITKIPVRQFYLNQEDVISKIPVMKIEKTIVESLKSNINKILFVEIIMCILIFIYEVLL